MLRWTPDGHVGTFRSPSNFANGNTRDRQGRLVTCEHMTRRVTRTELDGSITVIADRYDGRRLNSPNDVAVRADGTIWFTDPDYGLRQNVRDQPREQAGDYVFRFDPATGSLTVVVDDFVKPNGLAFSPDQSTLYVADSAVTDGPGYPSHIRSFRVRDDGTLAGGEVFATTVGRAGWDARRYPRARVGERRPGHRPIRPVGGAPAAGSGSRRTSPTSPSAMPGSRRMFVTAGHGLYAVDVDAQGAQWP